jgi:hypothetical protein
MPSSDEASAVGDTEADEMEEHLRGLGYLEYPERAASSRTIVRNLSEVADADMRLRAGTCPVRRRVFERRHARQRRGVRAGGDRAVPSA